MINIVRGPYECGETPVWDKSRKSLFWVNAATHTIHRWEAATGRVFNYHPGIEVTAIREYGSSEAGTMDFYLLTKFGLYQWTPDREPNGSILDGRDILDRHGTLRFNDGVPVRNGEFAAGAFDEADLFNGQGAFMIIDLNGGCRVIKKGLHVPNGVAYSEKRNVLFLAEMYKYRILKFNYNLGVSEAGAQEVFLEIPESEGKPDGLLLDHEDNLWVAHWRGWRISRYNRHAKRTVSIPTPYATPTCFCFGETEREMYITSATLELEDDEVARSYLPGGIFKVEIDAARSTGLKEDTHERLQ